MGFLAKWGLAAWSKIVLIAGIVAAAGLFVMRLIKAGADAERAKTTKAALDHQVKTGEQVSNADERLADPKSDRGKRVRDSFSRD